MLCSYVFQYEDFQRLTQANAQLMNENARLEERVLSLQEELGELHVSNSESTHSFYFDVQITGNKQLEKDEKEQLKRRIHMLEEELDRFRHLNELSMTTEDQFEKHLHYNTNHTKEVHTKVTL